MEIISISDSSTVSPANFSSRTFKKKKNFSESNSIFDKTEIITLSSTESGKETFKSSETQRCPVTWKKKRKSEVPQIPFKTPSPEKKVKFWMMNQQPCDFQSETNPESKEEVKQINSTKISKNGYLKSSSNQDIISIKNYETKCKHEESFPENGVLISEPTRNNKKELQTKYTLSNLRNCCNGVVTFQKNNCTKLSESSEQSVDNYLDNKSKNISANHQGKYFKSKRTKITNSPENQKKSELYSYLQLMDTSTTKNQKKLQNRRSFRVINHQKMIEKQKIESMLKSKQSKVKELLPEKKISESSNSTTMSFAELNMEPFTSSWQNNKSNSSEFHNNNNYFDGVMEKFLKEENILIDTNTNFTSCETEYCQKDRQILDTVKNNNSLCNQLKHCLYQFDNCSSKSSESFGENNNKIKTQKQKLQNSSHRLDYENYLLTKRMSAQNPLRSRIDYKEEKIEKSKTSKCNSHCENFTNKSIDERLKFQLNVFDNLTPEHRKALRESIKLGESNEKVATPFEKCFLEKYEEQQSDPFFGFKCTDKIASDKFSLTISDAVKLLEEEILEIKKNSFNSLSDKNNECISENKQKSDLEVLDNKLQIPSTESSNQSSTLVESQTQIRSDSCSSNCHEKIALETFVNKANSLALLTPLLSYITSSNDVKFVGNAVLPISNYAETPAKEKLLDNYLKQKSRSKISIGPSLHNELTLKKPENELKKVQSIVLNKNNGLIENAFFFDFSLILVQELSVSFWKMSPLGNILGAHDMWESRGDVCRLNSDDSQNITINETITHLETSVAYFEMWIKEMPSSTIDVIATVYFWLESFNSVNRKIILLDSVNSEHCNINYVVLKRARKILVTTFTIIDEIPTTFLKCYDLASDFQSITSSNQMSSVNYRLVSMHNILDCDSLIMGCGDQKITLWNVEHGIIVVTIDLLSINQNPITLWSKCDRGFLFVLQQFSDNSLKLIAINGINYTWKLLRSFEPSSNSGSLQGVCIENGILVAFFDKMTLCWKIDNCEEILELTSRKKVFVFDNNVISVSNGRVQVKNTLQYLLTNDDLYDTRL